MRMSILTDNPVSHAHTIAALRGYAELVLAYNVVDDPDEFACVAALAASGDPSEIYALVFVHDHLDKLGYSAQAAFVAAVLDY